MVSETVGKNKSCFNSFLFGVDYYPEHWPESCWEQDAERMRECNVNVVRMAEFAWYYFEPEEGVFRFDLFDRVIKILAAYNIRTILCTPTAAPPKWLTFNYPEVLTADITGRPYNDQTRRHYSYNSLLYRKFCRKITEETVKHYKDSQDVIGWQTDNEFNCHIDEFYGESDRTAFREWLKNKYKELDSLNERWGCRFWSQWYTDWEQIDLPFPAPVDHNPALVLDYKRFISDSVISFQKEQIDIIRKYRPDDFITHNGTFKHIDYFKFCQDLDIYSFDNYPVMYKDMQYSVGANLTLSRAFTGNFMIMEQQSGPSGQCNLFSSPRPGEMCLWVFQAIAHGADGIVHFRWRTAQKGLENYWYGILSQDNIKRGRYLEFKEEGNRINKIKDEIFGSEIKSDIAVIKDFDNEWVSDYNFFTSEVDLKNEFREFFKSASGLKYMVDFTGLKTDFSKYKIIFAPHLVLMDKNIAKKIAGYVKKGGIFILSAHSAEKDYDNGMTNEKIPVYLNDVFGIEQNYFTSYQPPSGDKNSIIFKGGRAAVKDGNATIKDGDATIKDGDAIPVHVFADIMSLKGAKEIAKWDNDYIKGWTACTENSFGKGKAVYYGSFFNEAAVKYLIKRYASELNLKPMFKDIPEEVEVTCRIKGGTEYYFILNHKNDCISVTPGTGFYDILEEKPLPDEVILRPFGYKVIKKLK